MRPADLLQIASDLAEVNTRRPRRADLCRAISTAYYAMFHCLARTCADTLAGTGPNQSRPAWRQAYRALEHGQATSRCKHQSIRKFPDAIQDFADTFAALQLKRHLADYDPEFLFKKSEVIESINRAVATITRFNAAPLKHRRAFAIYVLMKLRTDA